MQKIDQFPGHMKFKYELLCFQSIQARCMLPSNTSSEYNIKTALITKNIQWLFSSSYCSTNES
uniref:Uncharacterized protein n=1 Tax=Arundo donax TaxID=35708 RepID=A0A0A9C4A1_ARUDO